MTHSGPERPEIVVYENAFHGRSIAIVGFSSEPQYRDGFGPFAPEVYRAPYPYPYRDDSADPAAAAARSQAPA